MFSLQRKIKLHAQTQVKPALIDDEHQITYQQLLPKVLDIQNLIQGQCIGLFMDNSIAWALIDLALLFKQKCCVPLPLFFSEPQLKHSIENAQTDLVITDRPEQIRQLNLSVLSESSLDILGKKYSLFYLQLDTPSSHQNICKITYTSGSTGSPKGVMLDAEIIEEKYTVLANKTQMQASDHILSLLPLSTLLENIAGLYSGLFSGASVYLFSADKTGLSGSSQVDGKKLFALICEIQPSGFIVIPQLLALLVSLVKQGLKLPESLRFIAVGGAPVSELLLQQAEQLNIPVYQGYGLSEACSVVALNTIEHNRLGSVGQILKSHQVKIADDGEILLKGHLFKGYLGAEANKHSHQYYHTGDLGYIDSHSYLYINGRKKNIINTSYGRNISPEWLEKELEIMPAIAQSVIYGHGKPFVLALIVMRPDYTKKDVQFFIDELNTQLPDYAQIKKIILLPEAFSIKNQQLTGTGRAIREQIYTDYSTLINQSYIEK